MVQAARARATAAAIDVRRKRGDLPEPQDFIGTADEARADSIQSSALPVAGRPKSLGKNRSTQGTEMVATFSFTLPVESAGFRGSYALYDAT